MGKKLLGRATGVAALAADVARHLAWYLSHQVNGRPREADEDRGRRS